MSRVIEEFENFDNYVEELLSEFDDRTKNIFDSYAYSAGEEVTEFNSKLLNNSKRWLFESLVENLTDMRDKFTNWEYEFKKNADILR